MALYQPAVTLKWKYLHNEVSPNPNLMVVYHVHVDLLPNERLAYNRYTQTDTVITLTVGGNLPDTLDREWFAPFSVDYGLEYSVANVERIRDQIGQHNALNVATVVMKDGQTVGGVVQQTNQNGQIDWD